MVVRIMLEDKYCLKCGIKLDKSNSKYVKHANAYFCKKCAEKLEAHYNAEYTCAICGKKFNKGEIKILLTSKELSNEPIDVEKRFVCVDCYSKIGNRVPSKIKNSNIEREHIRKEISKSILHKTLNTINK
jgi:DNA-directed RNA polymerase subunit RPC12/RpoP